MASRHRFTSVISCCCRGQVSSWALLVGMGIGYMLQDPLPFHNSTNPLLQGDFRDSRFYFVIQWACHACSRQGGIPPRRPMKWHQADVKSQRQNANPLSLVSFLHKMPKFLSESLLWLLLLRRWTWQSSIVSIGSTHISRPWWQRRQTRLWRNHYLQLHFITLMGIVKRPVRRPQPHCLPVNIHHTVLWRPKKILRLCHHRHHHHYHPMIIILMKSKNLKDI